MIGTHIAYVFFSINVTFFLLLTLVAIVFRFEGGTTYVLYATMGLTLFNSIAALLIVRYLKTHEIDLE